MIFEVRKANQENGVKITDVMKDGGVLRIHRANFQRSFIKHLPLPGSSVKIDSTCNVHLSHRLVGYDSNSTCRSEAPQRGPVSLHFLNKPTTACDILVGADGIKSTVRQLFLARSSGPDKYQIFHEPVWSGSIAYRRIVDKSNLQHPVVYPISSGSFLNVVAVVHDKSKEGTTWVRPWNQEVTQNELFDEFSSWEKEFQVLIRCIHQPTRWALQSLNHLDVFSKDRVFLIGDSLGTLDRLLLSLHCWYNLQGAGPGVGIGV
ncbi:Salicylate hydroxylase [Leucoagaricus sp. SymC.cos]|nr:Salicylate hydroxylase [Leucoagaricus sp. SymC.cos]